jgi:hypothetical protein
MMTDQQTISDWQITFAFTNQVNLCQCGLVENVLRYIHALLDRAEDNLAGGWFRPTGTEEIFAAWVLDSWGLLQHAGSVDGGVFRTDDGDLLYRALGRLIKAGQDLLGPLGNPEGWGAADVAVPWRKAGEIS